MPITEPWRLTDAISSTRRIHSSCRARRNLNKILIGVANGWQLSGITQIQSGINLSGNTSENFNLNTNKTLDVNGQIASNLTIVGTPSIALQPILTCNPRSGLGTNQFVNGNCFAVPTTPGHNGPTIMPEVFGPAFFNSDLSLFKNFQISESKKLQFRFEAYNFLNHPLWSFNGGNNLNLIFDPATGKINNPVFGITTEKAGHRIPAIGDQVLLLIAVPFRLTEGWASVHPFFFPTRHIISEPVMYRLVVAVLCAGLLIGQAKQSPQDLLREAISLQQAGKLDEAIKDYQLLLATYPNQPQIRSNLGAALAGAGRYTEAIEQYKRAITEHTDPKVRLNLALAYYKASQFDHAIQELEKVREASPGDVQAVMLLADCELRVGDNKKVGELLTPLRRANPADLGIAYMLGTALVRDGQTAQGQLVIDQILKNGDSGKPDGRLGTTKMMVNDFSGALEDLKRAVDPNPNLPGCLLLLRAGFVGDWRPGRRGEGLSAGASAQPQQLRCQLRLGVLMRQDQDYDGAMKFLQHALKSPTGRCRHALSNCIGDTGARTCRGFPEISWSASSKNLRHLQKRT